MLVMALIEVKRGSGCESSQLSSPRSLRGSIPRILCKHDTIIRQAMTNKQHVEVKNNVRKLRALKLE